MSVPRNGAARSLSVTSRASAGESRSPSPVPAQHVADASPGTDPVVAPPSQDPLSASSQGSSLGATSDRLEEAIKQHAQETEQLKCDYEKVIGDLGAAGARRPAW